MSAPILTIVGARPNFMKAAPIHQAAIARGLPHRIIHTGQHFDDIMSKVFFEDLGMPEPHEYLGVGSGSHAEQTAKVMLGLEKVFLDTKPALVNVVGDVNSTMAAAIVASKLLIPVAHTEAGLRSGDRTMPEEINRLVTDAVADLLLTPSQDGDDHLLAEGTPKEKIVRVGNIMIDSLFAHLPKAEKLDVPGRLGLSPKGYAVLTMHRPSNVDVRETFERILGALIEISQKIPIAFPMHPRTKKQLELFGFQEKVAKAGGLMIMEPLGYLEFVSLMSKSKLVLTDSGGLQEETTSLGIPCITLRENTERPVTVTQGTNTIVGTDPERILSAAMDVLVTGGKSGRTPELWDGHTADRIIDAFCKFLKIG